MKRTHRCIPAKRKSKHTGLFAMLSGLLLLFPLLLPATALAAPRSGGPPLTKPGQIVDLAGVSVVRLSLEYFPSRGNALFCTTLGTIVASWSAQNATEKNNWVLTDGSLLNSSTKNSCVPGGALASIQLFANNEFTNNQPHLASFDVLNCATAGICNDGGVPETIVTLPGSSATLFSFHTSNPLPYVDVERTATTSGNPAPTSIELADSNNAIPPSAKNIDPTRLEQFLTPIANSVAPGSAPTTPGTTNIQTNEPGMPFIDGNGNITGEQVSNTTALVTIADIENLERQMVLPPGQTLSQLLNKNTLSQRWDNGIIQYEQGNFNGAIQTLSSIQNAPLAFNAPAAFIDKARAKLTSNNGTTDSTSSSSHGGGSSQISLTWLILVGPIAGVLLLLLLLVLVSIRYGRKRSERKRELERFEADVNRARALAEQEARRKIAGDQLPSRWNQPDQHALSAPAHPVSAAPSQRNIVQPQPQQPAQVPKMQDDPAIQAALQRLWDRAGR